MMYTIRDKELRQCAICLDDFTSHANSNKTYVIKVTYSLAMSDQKKKTNRQTKRW